MDSGYRPDIAVLNDDGTVALVEIKARSETTPGWAEQIRTVLVGEDLGERFFLLATRDHIYLWPRADGAPSPVVFDTRTLLGPFLRGADVSVDRASEETLALALSEWLLDFTLQPPRGGDGFSPEQASLMDFAKHVRNGRIVREPVSA